MSTPAAGASNMPAAPGTTSAPSVSSYPIRVPKDHNKKLAIMRFNASLGIDFTKWTQPKLERENNQVQFKSFQEEQPKFGAGSEYGREAREEARRKKYGMISKKYQPENQPWILQYGAKNERKKLRGVREGGVMENASYYMLTQAPDGGFEAFPVKEWYNFQTVQSYKSLSYEEAEEEFTSRNKTFNLFNVMVRKRMKKGEGDDGEDDGDDEEGVSKSKGKKKKGPKGDSRYGDDMDEMMESSGESSDDDDENDDDDGGKKAKGKKKGKKAPPRKKRRDSNGGLEDSDDGDGEGRELDYISSSDAESELDATKDDMKGVAEEDGLRKLLNSDEDSEEEEDENKDKEEEEEDGEKDDKGPKLDKGDKKKKKKKKTSKDGKKPRKEEYGSSSSSDSDGGSSASEIEKAKPSPKPKPGSANSSRSATPTKFAAAAEATSSDGKRKGGAAAAALAAAAGEGSSGQAAKKPRLDLGASSSATSSPAANSSQNEGVNEDSVRRYLQRKPMTTTELLQKFKSKKTGLSSDQLVHHIAQILKKINPVKQTIKGKMYLSIKNG